MGYFFDYRQYGFDDEYWEGIPRAKRCIIRDYLIYDGDQDHVQIWNFYDTDMMVRTTLKEYGKKIFDIDRKKDCCANR